MPDPQVAPYGAWPSPITSELILSDAVDLEQLTIQGDDLFWVEMRPSEGGRSVLVRCGPQNRPADVTPTDFSVRTRVHESGGGAYILSGDSVWFSNDSDQRLYRQSLGGTPTSLETIAGARYADATMDLQRTRLVCVREDHRDVDHEPVAAIVAVDRQTGANTVLVQGSDFYAAPRISPDGARIAWLQWDHPSMPWDATELMLADLSDDGAVVNARRVAGGPDVSVQQPLWSADGVLHFISDQSGWWNLYRLSDQVEAVLPLAAEFGQPMWNLGLATYGCLADGALLCVMERGGRQQLVRIEPEAGEPVLIETPYDRFRTLRVAGGQAAFIGASPVEPRSVVRLDLETRETQTVRRATDVALDDAWISRPVPITFPTEDGQSAHAYYYVPRNAECTAPTSELPPLLVRSHGGPTAATTSSLNLRVQYWTSRGFAVVDVNYRGSTGYGREYRERLRGQWGVLDVSDCVDAARYLVSEGLVDEQRLAIDGGSAGGLTTLNALTFRDVFRAGACYYGISDMAVLLRDTHKFESRYLESLVGPWPEARSLYEERSAIRFVERLSCPIIFFQGTEDKIVPPNQTEMMVDALNAKGLPCACLMFEGEGHGFRQAANIRSALDGEFQFFARVFGFSPADRTAPLEIKNLPEP